MTSTPTTTNRRRLITTSGDSHRDVYRCARKFDAAAAIYLNAANATRTEGIGNPVVKLTVTPRGAWRVETHPTGWSHLAPWTLQACGNLDDLTASPVGAEVWTLRVDDAVTVYASEADAREGLRDFYAAGRGDGVDLDDIDHEQVCERMRGLGLDFEIESHAVTFPMPNPAALAAQLDRTTRDALARALAVAALAEDGPALVDLIRARLIDEEGAAPAVVTFAAEESENGFYLGTFALVNYADGSTRHVDLEDAEWLLTGWGSRGSGFALAVNLATGEIATGDNGVDVRPWLAAHANTPAATEPAAPVIGYRFTAHRRPDGQPCGFSHMVVKAPQERTIPGDRRCGHDCPDSDVEPNPYADDQRYDETLPDPADEEPAGPFAYVYTDHNTVYGDICNYSGRPVESGAVDDMDPNAAADGHTCPAGCPEGGITLA